MPEPTLRDLLAAIGNVSAEVTASDARLTETIRAMREEMRNSFVAERTDREAQITRYRTDIMDRMDRLENSLTAIRDDIAMNYGTANAVRRANDNTRDEVRNLHDVVQVLERQIQRLQTDVRGLKGEP